MSDSVTKLEMVCGNQAFNVVFALTYRRCSRCTDIQIHIYRLLRLWRVHVEIIITSTTFIQTRTHIVRDCDARLL